MLSVIVILLGIILYALAYWGYVKWFDKNVIMSDPKKETPAHTYMDGVEFFPASKYVLFGFQWKSIAALGPVVGPIVALQWGWLPGLLWILFGTFFIGWIHDYGSLMVSCRSEGASFGPITYELISPRARTILLWYILWYIVLILSAFTNVVASLFIKFPVSPIPVLIVTIVGMLAGYMTYKLKVNIVYTTIIAVIIMFLGVWAGIAQPIKVPLEAEGPFPIASDFWMFITLLFCFLGAVLPIWVFIQPINYLSFYLVYAGIIGIIIGAFAGAPSYQFPTTTAFFDPKLTPTGPLWPMMFVTIACGAISGWHSLIGSSVSSKQLDSEPDAHFIGGGAMLAEGILALVALTAVAILSPPEAVKDILKAPAGWFVAGGSTLLGYLGIPESVGKAFTSVMLIILAITIMHIGLRITRLVLGDLTGPRFGGVFKNKYVSAIIVCIITYLVTSPHVGAVFGYIWGTFGGANQLMAGLALMIISLWLTREKRPTIYTVIPMLFMLATTLSALAYLSYSGITGYIADPTKIGALIAAVVNIFLLILGFFMCYEGAKAFQRLKAKPKEKTA
ncbi:MAG: carbon starvation CstA family protein [Armatimonadota bacterium]|nr:carbon starvation CstA family protein [Armatimonadota bacterium]